MKKTKSPCVKSCTDRKVGCRETCIKGYKEYEAYKRAEYEDRALKSSLSSESKEKYVHANALRKLNR